MSQHYQLQPGEKELLNETGLWNKAKLNAQPGRLVLTSQRILFVKDANPFAGPLLKLLMKKQDRHLVQDISLKDICSYSNQSFGLNKKIVSLVLASGETVNFSTSSEYAVWSSKLNELVKRKV